MVSKMQRKERERWQLVKVRQVRHKLYEWGSPWAAMYAMGEFFKEREVALM